MTWFRVYYALHSRAFHTRFRYGSVQKRLNQAMHSKSPVHYAKGTRLHIIPSKWNHSAPTARKYTVSGDGCYLGNCKESVIYFAYRTITFYGWAFLHHSAIYYICNFPDSPCPAYHNPHDPNCATHKGLTQNRFGLFPFRSPLLRKSNFFLFLELLRCFTSLRYLRYPIYSDTDTAA